MNPLHIPEFWNWFEDNLGRLRNVLQDPSHADREYVVGSLDHHILSIGRFSWDIEQGQFRRWRLIVSPNGDRELLALSREMIEQAPELDDWEFYPAKPRTEQPLKLQVYDENMDLREVDTRQWRYVLHPKGSDEFLLVMETGSSAGLSDETIQKAANYLLTCLVGEEARIIHLPAFKLVPQLDEKLKTSPLSELWDELQQRAGY